MANKKKQTEKRELVKGQEPKLSLAGVEAKLLNDFDRYSNGSMLMRMTDTEMTLTQDDKEVGTVGAAMGGGIFVKIENRLWKIDSISLFEAVQRAEKEQYEKGASDG